FTLPMIQEDGNVVGKVKAHETTQRRQQKTLRQKHPQQPHPSSTQRNPHGDLVPSRGRSREEQCAYVHTHNQNKNEERRQEHRKAQTYIGAILGILDRRAIGNREGGSPSRMQAILLRGQQPEFRSRISARGRWIQSTFNMQPGYLS